MKKYLLYIFICIGLTECKKYPDDQSRPHLESPEGRLCRGDFIYTHVYNTFTNAVIYNTSENHIWFTRHKKVFEGQAPFFNFKGTWELTNKKNNLVITDDKGNATEYIINQLDHNHLAFSKDSFRFDFTHNNLGH